MTTLKSLMMMLTLLMVSSVSARDWKWGNSNFIEWDNNCDFNGNDLVDSNGYVTGQVSTVEQCQDLCFQNQVCTHFTFSSGTCYLKRSTGQFNEIAVTGPSCGFIRGRSSQVDGVPFNTNVVWNSGCDFSGGDIANQQITGVNYPDVCGNLCLNTAGCTSFTWNGNNGICFLKNFKPLPNANLGFGNNVACGFIVNRVSSNTCTCVSTVANSNWCKVTVAASPGQACQCVSDESDPDGRTCAGKVVPCLDFSSPSCRNPGTDLKSCLQGKGNCYNYDKILYGSCGCKHYSGGCQISQAAPPGLACDCTNVFGGLFLTCSGSVTQCDDPTSPFCKYPDTSKNSCLMDRFSNCNGY